MPPLNAAVAAPAALGFLYHGHINTPVWLPARAVRCLPCNGVVLFDDGGELLPVSSGVTVTVAARLSG